MSKGVSTTTGNQIQRAVLAYGRDAVLVECDDSGEALALAAAVRDRFGDRLIDIVPGARTVLVQGPLDPSVLSELAQLPAPDRPHTEPATVELPTRYDGPDLDEVGRLTGLATDEVVRAHTCQLWTVAFCGFSPGFGYLRGENTTLRVPRRSTPRTRVPAGAVGLADTWSGVYPRPGPGGWQIIGRTEATLWNSEADPPAVLTPGTRVRFVAT